MKPMSALNRARSVLLILAVVTPGPRAASAMTVEMFDAMAIEDQHEYLTLLVRQARDVLTRQDQKDLAAKLDDLFQKRRGQRESQGEAQFERDLAIVRGFAAQQHAKNVNFKILPGEVENALIGTFQKNGIPMSGQVFKALSHAWTAKPYWPKRPLKSPTKL